MLQGTPETKRLARQLGRQMTMPEVLLWQRLRGSPGGIKFRKQHDAGKFVLDFYCHPARTVIEVDGIVHDMGDNPVSDAKRDQWLKSLGLNLIRIPARDVLADPDGIAQSIVTACCDAAAHARIS